MRWLAFPRGINVGGRRVPMAQLRALLAAAGCTDVRTVLASGNVAFTAPPAWADDDGASAAQAVRARVERLMSEEFGYDAIVQVYPADAVADAVAGNPFGTEGADEHHYLVFVDDPGVRAVLLAADGLDPAVDEVAPAALGVYWRGRKGETLSSVFGELIGTAGVKRHVTTRKFATLAKLLEGA